MCIYTDIEYIKKVTDIYIYKNQHFNKQKDNPHHCYYLSIDMYLSRRLLKQAIGDKKAKNPASQRRWGSVAPLFKLLIQQQIWRVNKRVHTYIDGVQKHIQAPIHTHTHHGL